MKNLNPNSLIVLLSCLIVVFLFNPISTFSQRPVQWVVGTPGMETNWNCHKNWSTSRIPDNQSAVYIPDVRTTFQSLPVVPHGKVLISELWIDGGASVEICADATLLVINHVHQNAKDQIHGEGLFKGPDYMRAGFDTMNARAYKYPLSSEMSPVAFSKVTH